MPSSSSPFISLDNRVGFRVLAAPCSTSGLRQDQALGAVAVLGRSFDHDSSPCVGPPPARRCRAASRASSSRPGSTYPAGRVTGEAHEHAGIGHLLVAQRYLVTAQAACRSARSRAPPCSPGRADPCPRTGAESTTRSGCSRWCRSHRRCPDPPRTRCARSGASHSLM